MTSDDLVHIVYENGNGLYVGMQSDSTWIVDQKMMPDDLNILLKRFQGDGFQLMRIVRDNSMSGFVGHPLALSMLGDLHRVRNVGCSSVVKVASITPVSRVYVERNRQVADENRHEILWP
jgi:hypothetical protein